MPLSLALELRRGQVLLGGEVALRVVLRNDGDTPLATASLFDNNQITNYVLSDAEDHVIATVNHITRQHLLEKVEPRTQDWRPLTLGPGQEESREDNLVRYHWFDRPGTYLVRALYRWQEHHLLSAPRRLDILPAPLRSYDQQWGYHYGEKFMLHSCWVAERTDGASELFLRESLRFRPQVINHNPSLGAVPATVAPRVSFDRTLMAGGSVWLAWLGQERVVGLRTYDGQPTGPAQPHVVPLTGLDWVAPPLRSDGDHVIFVLSGVEPATGRRVLAVELLPDGSEARRAFLTPPLPGAVAIQGVCDEDGGFHLFWLTDAHEVKHTPVDLATLAAAGPTRTLWRASSLLLGLFTPPVLTADSFLACVFPIPDDRALRLGIAWLQMGEAPNPLKVQDIALPGADTVLRTTGEMNQSGHVFLLVATPAALYYVNGALGQSRRLADAAELFPGSREGLTVNHRNDVFLWTNRRPYGLSEELVHAGSEEDLAEREEKE